MTLGENSTSANSSAVTDLFVSRSSFQANSSSVGSYTKFKNH